MIRAKARVAEEEGKLAEVEAELAGLLSKSGLFGKRMRRERKPESEEAARAREPRCMEVEGSEEEEEDEEDQEKLEGGKRRKVVRKGMFFRAGRSLDMDRLIPLLESLSRENKARCMRSLGE